MLPARVARRNRQAMLPGLLNISRSSIKNLKVIEVTELHQDSAAPTSISKRLESMFIADYLTKMKPRLRELEEKGANQADLLSRFSFLRKDEDVLEKFRLLAERHCREPQARTWTKGMRLVHLLAECGVATAFRAAIKRLKASGKLAEQLNVKDSA